MIRLASHAYAARYLIASLLLFSLALRTDPAVGQTLWVRDFQTFGVGDWNTASNWSLGVPNSGSGTTFDARIDNGGRAQLLVPGASVRRMRVGTSAGTGYLYVTGGGLTVTENLHLNEGGTSTPYMEVTNGGTVTAPSTIVGYSNTGDGTLWISGAGSRVDSTATCIVGYGHGNLFLLQSGTLAVGGGTLPLQLATTANSYGGLSIGGGGSSISGSLLASAVQVGAGVGRIDFAHNDDINFAIPISGPGFVYKASSGTTTLSAVNTYSGNSYGGTAIYGGTLNVTGSISHPTASLIIASVGNQGHGTLAVTNGGQVNNHLGYIGYSAGSTSMANIAGPGSSWINDSELYVGWQGNGTMNVTGGGQVSNTGDAYLAAFAGSSGIATVDGAASAWTVSDYDDGDFAGLYVGYGGNASLSVTNGGVVNAAQATNGINVGTSGSIFGSGTLVGNVASAGFVQPNNSTGNALLRVDGKYTQSSSGKLFIFADLFLPAGTNPRLEVTGDVALGGTLQMGLGGMGQFRGTRSFDVLDWGGNLSGTFSTIQLPTFGGAFTWDTSQLYSTGVLTLTGPPPETDFNHDGVVGAADYVIWRKTGDTESNYNLWRKQFGIVAGSGSGSTLSNPVPEPCAIMMLAIAVPLLCGCRHRLDFIYTADRATV